MLPPCRCRPRHSPGYWERGIAVRQSPLKFERRVSRGNRSAEESLMALVMAQANARNGRSVKQAPKLFFFDFPDAPELPHATLNGHTGGVIGETHFHRNDQFQVVVDGEFSIGRHALSPYCV